MSNDNYEQFDGYLQGSAEAEMDALLDELATSDRDAAPEGLDASVLDAVAGALAPSPLMIEQPIARASWFGSPIRYAAAAVLICGAAISVMLMQTQTNPVLPNPGMSIETVALEADVESLLALEEMTTELDESVAEWTLWAQAVDSDMNSAWMALDLIDSSLDENGAL